MRVIPPPMRPVAQRLLADRTYDIEFHGYLSNHVKHAIIALERLQAPEERVQEYWDEYTAVTPYNLELHKVSKDWNDGADLVPATKEQWKEWRGKKHNWQEQVAFMNQELEVRGGDTDQLVAEYAPDIVPGMAGALTHTIIHLGWAIDAGSPWMITEGLAYLNFAYVGLDASKLEFDKHDESDPMESLVRVAKESKEQYLQRNWIDRVKAAYDESFHPELVPAGFQWHLAKVLHEPHTVATELPTWINAKPIDDLWKSLYFATVYLYLATRDRDGNGNFVVLHLMTSLWGLEKTLSVYANEEQTRQALGLFFASLICVLSTASAGFPDASKLAHVQKDFAASKTDALDFDWEPLVKDGIAEREEHNIKLVYVMKELWNRYHRWAGFSKAAKAFTLTPNIGPQQVAFSQ